MDAKRWYITASIIGLLWYFRDFIFSTVDGGINLVSDFVGAGRRLTTCALDDSNVVIEDPEELRQQASEVVDRDISADAYALARMVRSEAGSADLTTKVRLANVAMNQARALGWDIYDVIVYHKTATRNGRYGAQISGRFASTRDPYESDLEAAETALRGDITGGATNFAHQSAFGKQLGTASSIQPFVDTMAVEGKQPGFYAPDSNLVFFWRGSIPSDATEGLG